MTETDISRLFNKKAIAIAALVAMAVPTWTSFQHDRKIHGDFQDQVNKNTTERILTSQVDGVTRQGYLNKGATIPVVTFGFYSYPTKAMVAAQREEAACWYTILRVTDGQEKLPFWQKLFGGAEYERLFANQAFDGLSYTCAPMQDEKTIESMTLAPTPPKP